jgi:hypothetical protein
LRGGVLGQTNLILSGTLATIAGTLNNSTSFIGLRGLKHRQEERWMASGKEFELCARQSGIMQGFKNPLW